MKKIICLFLLAGAGKLAIAQKADEAPYMTKSFANTSIRNVESETSGGNITVASVPASELRVEVFVWPSNWSDRQTTSKQEIESRLADYDINVSVNGGVLTASAKSKKKNMDWKKSLSISFRIFVPREVSTKLTTSGGNIKLSNLAGTQRFTTSGGNLNIDNLKGKMTGITSGGNIAVSNSDNDIDLTTSGGNINADNCTGTLNLTTSGGSVKIYNLSGNIDASTSGGNVTGNSIKGDLTAHTSGGNVNLEELSCSVEASTSGGHIDVRVKELGSFVRLNNSGGNISLTLPANKGLDLKVSGDKIRTDKLANFDGKIEGDEIRGKLNGGGTPITVSASSGRVTLTLQ
jgi:DUF4097 and DUF4098 domain-containing protein YvlB